MNDNLRFYKDPPARFRGAPFWSWNGKLDKAQLMRQIECFHRMGMGGYTIHVRTGLDTPYLSEEFMEFVRLCVEKGKTLGMESHLYDEDRWPSGYGGGEVTKEAKYRYRNLVLTTDAPGEPFREPFTALFANSPPDDGKRELLAVYDITLTDGFLTGYRRLKEGETGNDLWYVYKEVAGSHPWFGEQSYVDTLNPEATRRFLETTHEKYKAAVGDEFGKSVPDIFTDEPEYVHFGTLGHPGDRGPVSVPYTDAFDEKYIAKYGVSVFEHLPEVFWELPEGKASLHRYRFHDFVTDLFAQSYAKVLGEWCEENGIALTGHMMDENGLGSQTRSVGEAMRSYPYFQRPGIDVLCNSREYAAAKQAQSAAHQTGRLGLTSELYGVTNWDFDFRGHKLQGDWQAALGVIYRVHHLSYMTMAGEAKRDYPASIFYQSPWYDKYGLIEDYFARVNTALTTGDPHVRIGVIHPIESYWLCYGVGSQTERRKEKAERELNDVMNWLFADQLDYDFLSEALMETLPQKDGAGFSVGDMTYDVVIIPGCRTIRENTLARLTAFADAGGTVIFLGDIPTLVDVAPDDRPKELADRCVTIPHDRNALVGALVPYREVELVHKNGVRCCHYLYQMRKHGEDRILFFARNDEWFNRDIPRYEDLTVRMRGRFAATELVAMKGEKEEHSCVCKDGWTEIPVRLHDQDSLLLYLTAREDGFTGQEVVQKPSRFETVCSLHKVEHYETEEPNALLLDRAEFSLDDAPFEREDEVLRIDNICRRRVGYPTKPSSLPQPWLLKQEDKAEHRLTLKFIISSEMACEGTKLAVETQKGMTITLNGEAVDLAADGYFTDESIETYPLPPLKEGENQLLLSMDFTPRTNVEWCYLLGNFGVQLCGREATVTKTPRRLGFCDLTRQRMPFYAANLKLFTRITVDEEGTYALKLPKFRCPLLTVSVDDGEEIPVAFAPYTAELGQLKKGEHTICIRLFGNRYNCFGPLHLTDEGRGWIDPNSWRSEGDDYCYEYLVRPFGLLSAPTLLKKV